MTEKFRVQKKHYGDLEVEVYAVEHLVLEARIAVQFVERWGMVACIPDGEDSAGRSRLRLLTPEEMTTRAIETAKLLVSGLRDSGLMLQLPDLAELNPPKTD